MTIAPSAETKWLSLGRACDILGVNESTLRQWANAGRVRTFRTPGGHRRFSREDLQTLLQPGAKARTAATQGTWPDAALEGMRRRLHHRNSEAPAWAERWDDEGKLRMRVLGRRMIQLAGEYLAQKRRRGELEEEARFLGREYGRELASREVRLPDAVHAFLYFRNTLHESLGNAANGRRPGDPLREIMALEDQVLFGIAEAYEPQERTTSP